MERPLASGKPGCIGELALRNVISLPCWFPAEQAAAVLRKTGRRFAFITDRTGVSGVVDLNRLATAPQSKSVAWCAGSLAQAVPSENSVADAISLMDISRVDCLPVAAGRLIVGILTREVAEASLLKECPAEPMAA